MNKPRAVFHGDSFKQLMREYSTDRMLVDPVYRAEVNNKVAEERRKKAEEKQTVVLSTWLKEDQEKIAATENKEPSTDVVPE